MDKNIIKDYLNKTFLTEVKKDTKTTKVKEEPTQEKKSAEGTQSVPGVKVTSKINKESGKSNKEGVNAIAKEMKAYEAPLTKDDANSSEMAKNKFNYNSKDEETYHNDMEIMNGMEMLQYDRTPDENFKERALEAIEGSSRMGNNPDWANVVEKGWGGDKEFGKNLATKIKASIKKRDEQTPTSKMFGNDWEVVKDKGNKPYALENTNNQKSVIKEFGNEMGVDLSPQELQIAKKITGDDIDENLGGSGVTPEKIRTLAYYIGKGLVTSGVLAFCFLTWNLTDMSEKNQVKNAVLQQCRRGDTAIVRTIHKLFNDAEKGDSVNYPQHKNQNTLQESNKNKKQPMKRLKFKKEFNGVGNALKLIPESYRVDNKVFEMTDGNESYKVRWEGSLTEGAAVVLTASDKKMVNEDMSRMKALFNYKSQDTLGLLKGNARVDENASFRNIWDKTKKLLSESEDIEGQEADAEGEWDDAGITHAPEAKKHMTQASKTENGHQAPKPKEGIWSDIKPGHAADAKKHIQGSVSTEKGTQAPAPKEGNWEQIKIKGTTGVKGSTSTNTQSQAKKPATGQFDTVKKHAPEASKNVQGSTSTDKGTKAPPPKNGDWDKVKKSAPEATKHVSETVKKKVVTENSIDETGKINPSYEYFAVRKVDNKILTGFELLSDIESLKHYAKGDIIDMDENPKDFKLLSKKFLVKSGINPFDSRNWIKSSSQDDEITN